MTAVDPMSVLDFDSYLPEGEELYDYQHVGVAYSLFANRCLIGDEQGLGKTRQALVAIEAQQAYPAVVACKANLRGNWEREIRTCLPHRTCQVVYGSSPYETYADVVIVSYNLLPVWQAAFEPAALVLDESHLCKAKGTKKRPVQRTMAALALAARMPADRPIYLLTGTGILNRPVELVSQLQILGTLDQVAPKPRAENPTDRDWEYSFMFTFCGPTHNGHGYEFKGASNLGMLNERLRSTCYVRRLRSEVLGMEDTRRIRVDLSLNGALDQYRQAEQDLVRFLLASQGAEAAIKAQKAKILVMLSTLRKLAGQAKIEAAIEWIEDFFEENEGRSLVVFAHHREVQHALLAHFAGAAHILGGEKDPEGQKARFLSGEAKLIVCSLEGASEGHTLVGPEIDRHDVLMVEQGWHAGRMNQAEDRINRIGQTSQYVFSHTLIALDTIDEWVFSLIESKRAISKAVLDGQALDVDDVDIQAEVLRRLVGKFGQES